MATQLYRPVIYSGYIRNFTLTSGMGNYMTCNSIHIQQSNCLTQSNYDRLNKMDAYSCVTRSCSRA